MTPYKHVPDSFDVKNFLNNTPIDIAVPWCVGGDPASSAELVAVCKLSFGTNSSTCYLIKSTSIDDKLLFYRAFRFRPASHGRSTWAFLDCLHSSEPSKVSTGMIHCLTELSNTIQNPTGGRHLAEILILPDPCQRLWFNYMEHGSTFYQSIYKIQGCETREPSRCLKYLMCQFWCKNPILLIYP